MHFQHNAGIKIWLNGWVPIAEPRWHATLTITVPFSLSKETLVPLGLKAKLVRLIIFPGLCMYFVKPYSVLSHRDSLCKCLQLVFSQLLVISHKEKLLFCFLKASCIECQAFINSKNPYEMFIIQYYFQKHALRSLLGTNLFRFWRN